MRLPKMVSASGPGALAELPSMTSPVPPLAAVSDVGSLGVCQLKRFWSYALVVRSGGPPASVEEMHRGHLVTEALGVGRQQVAEFLSDGPPTFAEFEAWIVATAGAPEAATVERINAALLDREQPAATRAWLADIDAMPPVLDAAALAHWEEHGYVVVPEAVPEESRAAAAAAIWDNARARPDDPTTWYAPRAQGIMLAFFQHPAFTANRRAARVHKAFAQLWGTSDLWVTCDRGGFNPPLRAHDFFHATDLHWDMSLARPIPFGTQGILYLTDTPPEQGAFRCVPGFHHRLEDWLDRLPAGADPRQQDLHALGVKHIGGRAGDLVIWNDRLPHGASPNHGQRPRIVQYINMYPTHRAMNPVWL